MTSSDTFSITNKTSGNPPLGGLPFNDMKVDILGEDYSLSLVFVDDAFSKKLNNDYRGKNKPTNVLSFPVSDTVGEIFINVDALEREHTDFDRDITHYAAYLFIHGSFHLKGYEHSSKMDKEEQKIRQKYNV